MATGKTFSASISTVPALLLAPAPVLSKQWKQMFDSDKAVAPGVVVFSSSIFGYLAYNGTNHPHLIAYDQINSILID